MFKNIKSLVAISVVALSSCAAQPAFASAELDANYILSEVVISGAYMEKKSNSARIKEGVATMKNTLKDPFSAQTRNVFVRKFSDGLIVCGEVNAKNGMGAYTGYTKFAAGSTQAFFETNNTAVALTCTK